ncbi:tetratricopeptide repeat protein [Sphingomonas sp. dw_22]|uniref:O-linked N-acetylglucosamine transferase, SPINDLY family protein n=1 Tax=Sphingomonas sp. dw_22 TaxID=2721175 RepID=UPI001BD4DA5A|nr:tetratricopeptide repeat protein [Sphingomonas sp. dw_22]
MANSKPVVSGGRSELEELLARGAKFLAKGKPANALRSFDEALARHPTSAEAFCRRADALADLGQWPQALASYDRAIALDPQLSEAHDFKAVLLSQAGRLDEALRSVDRALAAAPGNFNALNNRAHILHDLGRAEEALAAFDVVIAREPTFPTGHFMRARILAGLGRHEAALLGFEHVIELDPQNIEAHCNRGTALLFLGKPAEGIEAFRHALALNPNHADALANLGDALASQLEYGEAEDCFRRCIEVQPNHVEAGLSLGRLLSLQRRFDEAGRCYQKVLSVDLNNARALYGLARAMEEFGQHQSALICYDHLLSFAQDDALAHQKRGQVMLSLSNQAEAIHSFDKAGALDPALGLPATRLYAAMHLSQWDGIEDQLQQVRDGVADGLRDMMAFPILSFADDPELQLESSRIIARNHAQLPAVPIAARYPRHEKIRIGYYSADFHHHATMQLFTETLEAHDRDRFELFGFWFGQEKDDQWNSRARASFDQFVDVRLQDDKAAALRAREMGIDIAIDLKGYTQNCRFGIFAERAAPIQAGYLGYPGTSGSTCIDYLLADNVVIHPNYRKFISEKVAYLPGSYQANARLGPISNLATRADAGLPEQLFVFCCFNQNYKIAPDVFRTWMTILRQVDSSVLWLWVDREVARANLSRSAEELGIDADRLIFANAEPLERHLDRLQLADLFLDTFPYNAHTSASDALRAGVPILTHAGKTFASRVAASLLTEVGLPELIVDSFAEYEALAIALGQDKARMAETRRRLLAGRAGSSLFDPHATARKLEAAYRAMYERYQSGEEPEDLRVAI